MTVAKARRPSQDPIEGGRGGAARLAAAGFTRVKIALTSACNLRCRSCFIDKGRGERLDPSAASATAAAVLALPGELKAVHLYGGEPLLERRTLEAVVRDCARGARRAGQMLRFAVATNGLLLDSAALRFFKAHAVHVCVSAEGRGGGRRADPDGRGTREAAFAALGRALGALGPRGVTALHCVFPGDGEDLERDVLDLLELGVRSVNFEIIQGERWTPADAAGLEAGLRRLEVLLEERVERGSPFYPAPLCAALAERLGLPAAERTVEIYPDGSSGVVPYTFVHGELGARPEGAEMLEARQAHARSWAERVLARAAQDRWRRYAREAARRAWT